jgi:hypothetical protein
LNAKRYGLQVGRDPKIQTRQTRLVPDVKEMQERDCRYNGNGLRQNDRDENPQRTGAIQHRRFALPKK